MKNEITIITLGNINLTFSDRQYFIQMYTTLNAVYIVNDLTYV